MTMARDNDEYVYRAFKLLVKGLRPFVERQFERHYGSRGREEMERLIRQQIGWQANGFEVILDAYTLLQVMERSWDDIFRNHFGPDSRMVRAFTNELLAIRGRGAHWTPSHDLSDAGAERALDTIMQMLTSIKASELGDAEHLKREFVNERHKDRVVHVPPDLPQPTTHSRSRDGEWPRRYSRPDNASAQVFVSQQEEGSYLRWVEGHPNGFVVNAPKPSPNSDIRLHKATCAYIRGEGKNLVGKDFFKVCSDDKEALEGWLDKQMTDWRRCGKCNP